MRKLCNFCGNKNFKNKLVQYVYQHDGRFMIVENVPCEQCEYCGEQYFNAGVLKKIEADFDDVYSHRRKATREVLVPMEQFA